MNFEWNSERRVSLTNPFLSPPPRAQFLKTTSSSHLEEKGQISLTEKLIECMCMFNKSLYDWQISLMTNRYLCCPTDVASWLTSPVHNAHWIRACLYFLWIECRAIAWHFSGLTLGTTNSLFDNKFCEKSIKDVY